MKKVKVIDKGIYSCSPDICKKYANPLWGIVTSLAGVALVLLWFFSPAIQSSSAASGWVLGLGVCGLLAALTLVTYYMIGDCIRPLYKPSKAEMTRYERYYDEANSHLATQYLMDGDFNAISKLPRAHQPLHMLILYRSEGGEMLVAQMVDATGVTPRPMCEMELFEKGSYELPDSLING